MKKDTYFFPHDFGARNDPKLQDVVMNLGQEGIGIYWGIIEMLYEQGGSLALDKINTISFQLHASKETVQKVVNDFGLFKNDGVDFWSDSVNRRLNKREEIAGKRRNAAQNRWNNIPRSDSSENQDEKDSDKTNGQQQDESLEKPPKKDKDVDFKAIVDMYHSICKSYPRVVKLSEARKNKIRIRFEEMEENMDTLRTIFEKMEASKFMRGDNKAGWKAFFDWVFENEKNWCKIFEGNYDNKNGKASNGKNSSVNDEWK